MSGLGADYHEVSFAVDPDLEPRSCIRVAPRKVSGRRSNASVMAAADFSFSFWVSQEGQGG